MMNTKTIMVLLEHGETVIADIKRQVHGGKSARLALFHPAKVIHERPHSGALGFMLVPWIPTELTTDACIEISRSMIRGILSPSPELVSFYQSWAATERDKWKHFGQEFCQQVATIEKMMSKDYTEAKLRKAVGTVACAKHNNNELLFALFDEDANWGNTAITQ